MAGEFLAAGKLFKYGLLVSITLGNAKAIDLLVHNPLIGISGKNFNVQVKTNRKPGCFLIKPESISPSHIYVFVLLNNPKEEEKFYIIPGSEIIEDMPRFFGGSLLSNMPAINYGSLKPYLGNWGVFWDKGTQETNHSVVMEGWREGLRKVALANLIIETCGMSSSEAKKKVNGLLEGEQVSLDFADQKNAHKFIALARDLGAIIPES